MLIRYLDKAINNAYMEKERNLENNYLYPSIEIKTVLVDNVYKTYFKTIFRRNKEGLWYELPITKVFETEQTPTIIQKSFMYEEFIKSSYKFLCIYGTEGFKEVSSIQISEKERFENRYDKYTSKDTLLNLN